MMLITPVIVHAQTDSITDSIGVATTSWQTVNLLVPGAKGVEIIHDDVANNLLVAVQTSDTSATRSRYRRTIKPGEILKLSNYTRLIIYVKASAGTIAYRIGTY